MNAKQWLILGGLALILLGVLGFAGVIGPTASDSIFGPSWYFDNAENYAHLILGVVAVIAAFVLSRKIQKPLVFLLGLVALFFGIYSLVIGPSFSTANLENPADTLLHLVVGIWALVAAANTKVKGR